MKNAEKKSAKGGPESAQAKGARKQRNQLIVLGTLSMVLVAVLVSQLGGEADYTAAVLPDGVAQASTEAPEEQPALEEFVPDIEANPVLSEAADDELSRDPFSAFWQTESVADETNAGLVPPTVTLNATMPNGDLPLAILDGQMRFQGDNVQGWTLEEIGERRIVLRAPSQDTFVIEMPLLHGRIDVPSNAFATPEPSNPSFTDAGSELPDSSSTVADSQ